MSKSDISIFLAAFISFLLSIALWFGAFGSNAEFNQMSGIFVGLWVPSILGIGLYFQRARRLAQ